MYQLYVKKEKHRYILEELVREFLRPDEYEVVMQTGVSGDSSGEEESCGERKQKGPRQEAEKEERDAEKRRVFDELTALTGYRPEWGTLTGVRPAKLAGEMMDAGYSEEETAAAFRERYYVNDEKTDLVLETCRNQRFLTSQPAGRTAGVYIGIPFCPTRCLYCSFASNPADPEGMRRYLEALLTEIDAVSEKMKEFQILPESVYFGGGTPTSLSAGMLEKLLSRVTERFDMSGVKEFCVEAGRPDTVTEEKLLAMKRFGVDRISINPQTMNDETLRTIGRAHNAAQVKEAFAMARQAGFDNINMDLIAGLPGEDLHAMKHTLEEIRALAPESLTVHSLAIKRAANLNQQMDDYKSTIHHDMDAMHTAAQETAQTLGMEPYYLYRQKNIGGNLENVGYAKPGCECLYNILIMEEMTDIIAAGAGASTKLVYHAENRVERVENCKSVDDYINRFDEMLDRKRKAF